MLGPVSVHSEWQLVLLAAAFGGGAALYIAGPFPLAPSAWAIGIGLAGLLILGYSAFRQSISFRLAAFLLLGVTAAAYRVSEGTAPIVTKDTFVRMDARVERLEIRPDRPPRLLLSPLTFSRHDIKIPPHIRLVVRTSMAPGLVPGDIVTLSALLTVPGGPVVPDGYDYARTAYFAGIGAGGYATGPVVRKGPRAQASITTRLLALRLMVADRITGTIPGQAGALAVALTVGFRNNLSLDTESTLRRAGLSHLLAISGLHMGLVTAAAFFFLEFLFAAIPALALRVRPKKLAAVGAWLVALGYLLLSGAGITTIRAFVMVSVALLAVLLDRRVLSLRSVALAALAVLILWPEAVLSIGFQMSFAATAVLVAFYEYAARHGWLKVGERPTGILGRSGRFLQATLLTTLVAQVAVAPFALYHFQSVSLIGVAANLVVVPVVSLLVMPLALLTLSLMPLGLDMVATPILKLALSGTLWLAHGFAAVPMAVVRVGAPDPAFLWGVAVMLVAGLVLRGRWIALPVTGFVILCLLNLPSRQADVLIANGGRVIAARQEGAETMAVAGGRRDSFRDIRWQQYWGLDPLAEDQPLSRRCDTDGCRTIVKGHAISVVRSMEAMRLACGTGDIVILPWRWRRYCHGAQLVIADEDIEEKGPAALFWQGGDVSVKPVLKWANPPIDRPWHPVPWYKRQNARYKPAHKAR
ncbi:ComEC/Rec2 family competence protein [Kordiimonas marina]|uniref:ComEC/Rec2 family competence protein n=1 Tax=Kordiimonas marina TaxID=2872312 RepID=UPI001FF55C25|nr:ComEC/Rec2 family competence protein [Kordiimonas marina]MCJ9428762.1 ComEC family competence protein [Kordiimonas marina]